MLLVSCCGEGGSLFTIDEVSKIVDIVFPFDCTGITKSDTGDIYAFSHTLRSIFKFNKNFVMKKHQIVGNDFHGLLYHNGYLYSVDTFNDRIYKHDPDTLQGVFAWSFNKLSIDKNNDLFHINDIFITDDNDMLISMFRDFSPTEEQRFKQFIPGAPGKVYKRSLSDESNFFGELLLEGLTQPHTPVIHGNKFYVCNSKRESLVIDGNEKYLGLGFTRGLLVTEDKIYVGTSNSAKRVESEEFDSAICGIAVLDKNSLSIVDFIPLPSNEVYGILEI